MDSLLEIEEAIGRLPKDQMIELVERLEQRVAVEQHEVTGHRAAREPAGREIVRGCEERVEERIDPQAGDPASGQEAFHPVRAETQRHGGMPNPAARERAQL